MTWIALAAVVATSVGGPASGRGGGADCVASNDGRVEPTDVGVKQCFVSPDGRKTVIVSRGRMRVRFGDKSYSVGSIDYGTLAWNAASTGFVVADSGGSGQSSYFSYVDLRSGAPHRTTLLRKAAIRKFAQTFQCGGQDFYGYAWFNGWQDPTRVRLVVQAGVHSEGCHYPNPEVIEIGIVGDPTIGRIDRILRQDELEKEWCTPADRQQYGFCAEPTANRASGTPPGSLTQRP